MSSGEFNKTAFYLKGLMIAVVVGYFYFMGTGLWVKFKDWAMERKAKKMVAIIENGFCFADGKCTEKMNDSRAACIDLVTKMRSDKNAPDFNAVDRRLAIGCMHKGYMASSCENKQDEKKKNDCLERVGKRHEKCFEYTWAPGQPEIPKNLGSGMIGCLYGVMFVQDDSAGPGISVEDTGFNKKKPKLLVKPIELDHWPTTSEVNELKEQLQELGDQRVENFNEAMDALQEMRGGAAVDQTADIDVFDQSGKSARDSGGAIQQPADDGVERAPSSD